MTSGTISPGEELLRLLDELIREEWLFKSRMDDAEGGDRSPEKVHSLLVDRLGGSGEHGRLRQVHEQIFRVHRKIDVEHDLTLQRCNHVCSRVRTGFYTEPEIALELARARTTIDRIKRDHSRMARERQTVRAEHDAFARTKDHATEAE